MKKNIQIEYKYLKREYSYVFGLMVFFSSTFFIVFDYILGDKYKNYNFEFLELQTYSLIGLILVFTMILMFFIKNDNRIKFIIFKVAFSSSLLVAILIYFTLFFIAFDNIYNKVSEVGQRNYLKSLYIIGASVFVMFLLFLKTSRKNRKKK